MFNEWETEVKWKLEGIYNIPFKKNGDQSSIAVWTLRVALKITKKLVEKGAGRAIPNKAQSFLYCPFSKGVLSEARRDLQVTF